MPAGETAARPASSRSLRGLPPKMEMAHIPVVSPDSPGPTAATLVPSRNQERLAHQKQNPSGTGREWVSPVSSTRTKTPVKSAYVRYLPSGEIAAWLAVPVLVSFVTFVWPKGIGPLETVAGLR